MQEVKSRKSQVISQKSKVRKAIFIILSVFCLLYPVLCLAQESSKEEETLFVAKKAFEDGFYEVSLGLLERFLKNYPT